MVGFWFMVRVGEESRVRVETRVLALGLGLGFEPGSASGQNWGWVEDKC